MRGLIVARMSATLFVDFQLTRKCNFACRYCHVIEAAKRESMDTQEMELCIDWVRRVQRPVHVFLTGGEPLLSEHLELWISATGELKDLLLSISTNASMLTQELVTDLEKARIGMIIVSMDGWNAETHDWHSRHQGSFDAAVAGLSRLMDSTLKDCVVTNTVVTRRNISNWPRIADLSSSIGVKRVKFSPVLLKSKGESSKLALRPADIESFLSIRSQLDPSRNMSPKLFDRRVADVLSNRSTSLLKCFAGRRFLFVRSDARVFPCWQASDGAFTIRYRLPSVSQADEHPKLYELPTDNSLEGVMANQVKRCRDSICLDCCDAFNIYLHESYCKGKRDETGEPLDV